MNRMDKGVLLAVVAVLMAVLVRTILDAAAALLIPVMACGSIYGGYRVWRSGLLDRWLPKRTPQAQDPV